MIRFRIMRRLVFLLFPILCWTGCSVSEESVSFDPNLSLTFSTDSVKFDTLLSERRSSTQRLTILNPNEQAIQLEEIGLRSGESSDYSLIINGKATSSLKNERIMGGDSLLILVEVDISSRNRNAPYLVDDAIVVRWNSNSRDIDLVAYGQDSRMIDGSRVCNETWTNDRPYIVSDTVVVGSGCRLTIEKGARIFFENGAALFVLGTLDARGDSADQIIFRNTRFDGIYDQVPGQWNGIYFLEGSQSNVISYAQLFNGQIGLRIGTPDDNDDPDVSITNTQIFNMSVAGVLAFTSDVSMTNSLVYNCGNYLVGGFAGGNYSLVHCTLSDDPPLFINEDPSVQFSDNLVIGEDELLTDNLSLTIVNSIIWGQLEEELLINNGGGTDLAVTLQGNILRSAINVSDNFSSQESNFPGFVDPFGKDYSLDTLSFAVDKGIDVGIINDLKGNRRDSNPDIGAFERKDSN